MEEGDTETMVAYYCFVNLGWAPSKYVSLPYRERALIAEFAIRDTTRREKEMKASGSHGRRYSYRRR